MSVFVAESFAGETGASGISAAIMVSLLVESFDSPTPLKAVKRN
jgi:hypothetical protein